MDSLISNGAKLRSDGPRNGLLKLSIDGRLDADSTGRVWRESTRLVSAARAATVDLDASAMDYCDGSGIALLIQLRRLQQKAGGKLEIHGLRPEFQELLDDWSHGSSGTTQSKAKVRVQLAEEIGQSAVQLWDDMREVISFIGQLGHAMVKAALHPSTVRWRDTLLVAEELGVNALPIVALLSFLVGVIMAFQAAVALRQFGAEIFVANMIGLSVLREMGPLMTAIILAGRSGSAFAAEIGTMKVREEIDALKTMGLEPVRFLVVPRVLAGVAMTPVLTVFADLFGVMGGSVVMMSLGFPLITFFNQLQSAVSYGSLVGGLVKAFAFGILIAAIGCLRGLQTETGASAVGLSTTHAVVSDIILIVITDGIFSVIYYYLWV
ncbi:MAG TPA: MlaE family lipid ABC transporter permease subunit [Candidatus Deferrimicrobium sp.]|nr:MlaE family lipid ABC transporter permease subunit [Candidatus Deferrimicrobium sp.]